MGIQDKLFKYNPRLYNFVGEVIKYIFYALMIPLAIAVAVTILGFIVGGFFGVWFGWKWVIIEPILRLL